MKILNEKQSWLKEIIEVIAELGGEATLKDIYGHIKERGGMKTKGAWENTVRRTIYNHSNDCDGFKGKEIFYSVRGLGDGIWGIYDYKSTPNNADMSEDDIGFPEGKKKARLHISRERNPKVIRDAKKLFEDTHNGRLFCEICKFEFSAIYGELGKGFIEGHHLVPLSEIDKETITKVEDIAIVCSNCHRMLHRRRPWLGKKDLIGLISKP